MKDAAEEVLGRERRRKNNGWFDEECHVAAEERKKKRKEWLDDRGSMDKKEKFRQARNKACETNRRKKRQKVETELIEIEEDRRQGRTRKMYKGIKKQRNGYQPRNDLVKDKEGKILVEGEEIQRRWIEYFNGLLNRPEPTAPHVSLEDPCVNLILPPRRAEILHAIKKLKNNKSAGSDEIYAELLKYGGDDLHAKVIALISKIWNDESMPEEWEEGVLVALHKKGDRTQCDNYRGICVLPTGYKILVKLIYQRLQEYTEEILGEYQAGFRRGRGTSDQIFILRQILEKYREFNKTSYHLFIDFKQAYDSIHRPSLWSILNDFNIPVKLIRLIQMCYRNTRCRVKVAGELTDSFSIQGGLKQGCCLSTLLFNLSLEWIVRQTPMTRCPIVIGNAKIDKLAFADDVDMMDEVLYYLEDTFIIFEDVMCVQPIQEKKRLFRYDTPKPKGSC